MLGTRAVICLTYVGLTILSGGGAAAQNYPNKPVRIVTGAVASGGDGVSRFLAPELAAALGKPVIVENRQGIGSGDVASRAAPDGYTLLVAPNIFLYAPLLQKITFDPVRDFAPISLLMLSPIVLVVNPALPAKSVKELIALAKAKPGVLNYASGGTGGTSHLTSELFNSMAGINIVRISYKGNSLALNALLGGEEVQITFDGAGQVMPFVKGGKLRALAVTTAQRSAHVPGVPTVAESLPGFEAASIYALFAPAKTPDAIINRLNQEIVRILNRADIKEKSFGRGQDAVSSSPTELAAMVKSELITMGKVIKDAGIKAE